MEWFYLFTLCSKEDVNPADQKLIMKDMKILEADKHNEVAHTSPTQLNITLTGYK